MIYREQHNYWRDTAICFLFPLPPHAAFSPAYPIALTPALQRHWQCRHSYADIISIAFSSIMSICWKINWYAIISLLTRFLPARVLVRWDETFYDDITMLGNFIKLWFRLLAAESFDDRESSYRGDAVTKWRFEGHHLSYALPLSRATTAITHAPLRPNIYACFSLHFCNALAIEATFLRDKRR